MEYSRTKYRLEIALLLVVIFAIAFFMFMYRDYLFAGIFNFGDKERKSTRTEEMEGGTKKLSVNEEKVVQKKMDELVALGDPDKCSEITNEVYRTACFNNIYLNKAKDENNAIFCQKLDGKLISVEQCERQIVFAKAAKSDNISVCQEASSEVVQKECELNFAVAQAHRKGNRDLCGILEEQDSTKRCENIYYFLHDFTLKPEEFNCSLFSEDKFKADCENYQKNSRQAGENLCINLKTTFFQNFCQEVINHQVIEEKINE